MKNFIKGLVYGISSICPGLSGGMIAIKLGDYNRIISIFYNKNFTINNITYLIKLCIGFLTGTIIFSNIINYLYSNYQAIFSYIVLLISLYLLFSFIIYLKIKTENIILITFISIIVFIVINNISLPFLLNNTSKFLISGFIFSFSKIIPGISGTSILINIGFYGYLINFFSNPFVVFSNFYMWVVFWFSFIFSTILIIKFIYNKKSFLNYIVIIVMIINILMMIK